LTFVAGVVVGGGGVVGIIGVALLYARCWASLHIKHTGQAAASPKPWCTWHPAAFKPLNAKPLWRCEVANHADGFGSLV
jgi:hypothetical protein